MHANSREIVLSVFLLSWIHLAGSLWSAEPEGHHACQVVRHAHRVELQSPSFVFRLNMADGLRASSWTNRLTTQTLELGGGPELEIDIGLPDRPLQTPPLEVSAVQTTQEGETGEVVFTLAASEPALTVLVTYRWNANEPVLRKFVAITNTSDRELDRVLNIRLGRYDTGGVRVSDRPSGGTYCVPAPREFPSSGSTQVERGFPVYAADEFFFGLAHPAGIAEGSAGRISLRQYPGVTLAPSRTFSCMEVVYGVAKAGAARQAFVAHVQGRMRRVVRGHDRPYAIFEPFGARPCGNFEETEEFVLDNIAKVAEGQRESGCHFDLYSVDFWVDYHGDLKQFDPLRFPNGLARIREELDQLGTAPGLWIDGSMESWSIGGNPRADVQACLNYDLDKPETLNQVQLGRKAFCRATDPIRSMYTEAFRHHIRDNGVRLLKFDNTSCVCVNPRHEHLPGLYSTEPIVDGLIEFFRALDEECPDVFLMLYWGYRSPWWLLHADTLFDSGLGIEAASPSAQPAPYARDSVTQRLDQAQWRTADIPPLGKDSLGVWLSDWGWNSSIGAERWQSGVVMDISRGSLLAQIWSDTPWLSPPEREQMAEFIALLKAQPACFANPRFILGDPWEDEPYGYCCTDGRRAFLALNNSTWEDSCLPLTLNATWGLPDGQTWDLYRWYPAPARLSSGRDTFGEEVSIWLRPFETLLLEVVPLGERPSLDRPFEVSPLPPSFDEPTRAVEVTVTEIRPDPPPASDSRFQVLQPAEAVSAGGATLTTQPDGSILAGGASPSPDTYRVTATTELTEITAFRLEVLPDDSLPAKGPGRAFNGNFALNRFRITAAPSGSEAQGISVALKNPVASYAQESHGGWPIAAALDDDPQTGWSVDPHEGSPHVAVFETAAPVGFPGGTRLTFTLDQGQPAEHNLGRLRLSATAAQPPFSVPITYGPRQMVVRGEVPATAAGGMLVVTVAMRDGSNPLWLSDVGKHFSCTGTLDGREVTFCPVLGKATYPAPWQAWRTVVEPSATPRAFELTIGTTTPSNVQWQYGAHFIPQP